MNMSQYRVLYELEKEKNQKLKIKNKQLAELLGIYSINNSRSLIINDENNPFEANVMKRSCKGRKQLQKIQPIVISQFSIAEPYKISQSQIVEIFIMRSINNNKIIGSPDQILLSWEYDQLVDLNLTKFNLTNFRQIKSLVGNIIPIAYKHQKLIQQYSYVAEIHRFNSSKIKYYLSVTVYYRLFGQYYFPEVKCFLSEQQPNIEYLLLKTKMSLGFENQKLFNKLDILHNLNSLYLFYRQSCGISFLDELILDLLLEKSVLVKGKSSKHVCQLVYLLSHYAGINLTHVVNYQIMDPQLLNLPAPFIFGSTQPSVIHNLQKHSFLIIDLDKSYIHNIPKTKYNFDVRSFIAHLFQFLEMIPKQLDFFDLISIIERQFDLGPLRHYMIQFVRTMTFHELYHQY